MSKGFDKTIFWLTSDLLTENRSFQILVLSTLNTMFHGVHMYIDLYIYRFCDRVLIVLFVSFYFC
jgi:hypothetical protein